MFGIKLITNEEKEFFVKIANKLECDVILKHGSQEVDGKSLVGVLALDTTNDCYVKLSSSDPDVLRLFTYTLSEFLA